MNSQQAQSLATTALLWLAGQPDELGHFVAATGNGPADIRARASDPEFLGFVLDFLMGSDELAREFCTAEGLAAERLLTARAALPGGSVPNWT